MVIPMVQYTVSYVYTKYSGKFRLLTGFLSHGSDPIGVTRRGSRRGRLRSLRTVFSANLVNSLFRRGQKNICGYLAGNITTVFSKRIVQRFTIVLRGLAP